MKVRLAVFALLISSLTIRSSADPVIVVHPSVNVSSLTQEEVKAIFLRTRLAWADGSKIVPVDQLARASVRVAFSKKVHGKSVHAVVSYWLQQVFSGRQIPPLELENDAAVITFVQTNRGAIGYVSDAASTAGLTVVRVK